MASDQLTPRLVLLRHAKSDWPAGVDDLERPLGRRGIADASQAGRELAAIAVPDVVLCSPAWRTRQTWGLVEEALKGAASDSGSSGSAEASGSQPLVRFVPALYGASVAELISLLQRVPAGTGTALVIGHEPTMSATAREIAGPDSAQDDLAHLRAKYPSSGMAVFRLGRTWAALDAGSAALERFLIPRG